MSNKATTKAPHSPVFVSLHMLRAGEVEVLVTGKNGVLGLTAYGDQPGVKLNGEHGKLLGAVGIKTNGHLRGFLARGERGLEWFPQRLTRTGTKAKAGKGMRK